MSISGLSHLALAQFGYPERIPNVGDISKNCLFGKDRDRDKAGEGKEGGTCIV